MHTKRRNDKREKEARTIPKPKMDSAQTNRAKDKWIRL